MFIQEISASTKFEEAKQKFRDNISAKHLEYADADLKLDPSKLPEIIQLGVASWLLAVPLLFKSRTEILWDGTKLHEEARAVNKLLFEKVYLIDLNSNNGLSCNDGNPNPNLTPSEKKQLLDKMLLEKGIEGHDIYYDFNGRTAWNYTIRKKLLLELIQAIPMLKDCLINHYPSQKLESSAIQPNHQGQPNMLPHVRQANILKRIDQVLALLLETCTEHPIKIVIDKIKNPIQSINLAWIIAICQKNYDRFADIDFKDLTLNSLQHTLTSQLIEALHEDGIIHELKPKYFQESDIVFGVTSVDKLSYEMPPEVVSSLINANFKDIQHSRPKQDKAEPIKLKKSAPTFNALEPIQYTGNAINIAVIQQILPLLLPDKQAELTSDGLNKLCWDCFQNLQDMLGKNGIVTTYKKMKNRKETYIAGKDEYDESFNISYDAFRKRFKTILIIAYRKDLPCIDARF
ncbi:hypothetical protein TUM19329_06760 [Legionella antarctica]|uniref:Uncharacterized protein n=1 Tax=Legionella antarctica TaxID=2708020 RepID=A0A6F8T0Y3_9GAMM|nr:hypothetical protein [Legionella antarctica]BCA94315.1 hypothetical protein TUM19329_06760 [Legionella antarctica]